MNRQILIADLLKRYGSSAVCEGKEAPVLIRPMNQSSTEDDRYLCTAPFDFCLKTGDRLQCMEHVYTVLRCDGVFAEGHRLYTWAVLELQDGWGR